MNLRTATARLALPATGLPRAPDRPGHRANWPKAFSDPDSGPTPSPKPLVPYLRWLAQTKPVVFHGSQQRGLVELHDKRRSRDTRTYGDRAAVFASQDPVWALFFAVLRRDTMRSTRNASLGADVSLRNRRYFFSVDADDPLFGPGALYVLPADGFAHEPRLGGLFDTAHRTRVGTVRALGWFEVEPDDFPLVARTISHTDEDSIARTIWTAGWGYRRSVRNAERDAAAR